MIDIIAVIKLTMAYKSPNIAKHETLLNRSGTKRSGLIRNLWRIVTWHLFQTCPSWTEWGEWSECSRSCDGGQKRRLRRCIDPNNGEESFCGDGEPEEIMDCNTQARPLDIIIYI